jgi:hypothetical protein
MMRSESTSALGQPRLTKPILGGALPRAVLVEDTGMGALIGKRETLVCRRV